MKIISGDISKTETSNSLDRNKQTAMAKGHLFFQCNNFEFLTKTMGIKCVGSS